MTQSSASHQTHLSIVISSTLHSVSVSRVHAQLVQSGPEHVPMSLVPNGALLAEIKSSTSNRNPIMQFIGKLVSAIGKIIN